MYRGVVDRCYQNRLGEYVSRIHYFYDSTKKEGRVWTDDLIIIFNEFGTGIKGTQDEYASKHGYTVNLSGKGESGWVFPTKDGKFKVTHGIRSKHMFYEVYEIVKKEFSDIVEISVKGAFDSLY